MSEGQVRGSIFDDNLKNGKGHKPRTYNIHRCLISRLKCSHPEKRKFLFFRICKVRGMFKPFIFDLHWHPYRAPIQQQTLDDSSSILYTHICRIKMKLEIPHLKTNARPKRTSTSENDGNLFSSTC